MGKPSEIPLHATLLRYLYHRPSANITVECCLYSKHYRTCSAQGKLTCLLQKLQRQAELPCSCADTPHVHKVEGHLVVRKPAHVRTLFGSQPSILLHDLQREIVPSWYKYKHSPPTAWAASLVIYPCRVTLLF